jgi:hypothetical protein
MKRFLLRPQHARQSGYHDRECRWAADQPKESCAICHCDRCSLTAWGDMLLSGLRSVARAAVDQMQEEGSDDVSRTRTPKPP